MAADLPGAKETGEKAHQHHGCWAVWEGPASPPDSRLEVISGLQRRAGGGPQSCRLGRGYALQQHGQERSH